MPSRADITYFGAGPALLPTPVLEAASKALLNYNSTGLGLAEHSHRSALANQILADTKSNLKSLLDIPDDYEVLFMQGGGSGEFSAVVYNLVAVWVERRRRRAERDIKMTSPNLNEKEVSERILERLRLEKQAELKLDYLISGSWSLKASQEAARLLGEEYINVVFDARKVNSGKFGKVPAEDTWKLTSARGGDGKGPAFVYYCDNETVDGVEFPNFPKILEPKGVDEEDGPLVVADMSSNILSRRVDIKKYGLIFAGAQKNVGTTGLTLVIIRKSLLPPATAVPSSTLLHSLGLPVGPVVFDYPTISKNNSLYNTLSIFDVWVAGQVMGGLLQTFGSKKVSGMEEVANSKANLIYGALEKWPTIYQIVPDKTVRSRMNICFRVHEGKGEKEKDWLAEAENRGLMGLKGHRSVGGIRCSNYNSISLQGAQKLVEYLEDYAHDQTP